MMPPVHQDPVSMVAHVFTHPVDSIVTVLLGTQAATAQLT